MSQSTLQHGEAREAILRGVTILADTVEGTLGRVGE